MPEDKAVRIQGKLLGHPIDVTITECDEVASDTPSVEEKDAPIPSPVEPPVPTPPVGDETVDTPDTPVADPAPAVTDATDEPKNPEGNAEQL